MKEEYNWWKDPKNLEEVNRISWWTKSENRAYVELPIALVNDGIYWVASTIDENKFLGEHLHSCVQARSQDEAISKLFEMIRFRAIYSEGCRLRYQRFVPFRKGPWGQTGGNWISVFGIHIYIRYGKTMKGGWYVPFTQLNISTYSDWCTYRKWKKHAYEKLS